MRAALVTSAAACAAAFQVSNAFTHSPTTSLVVKHRSFYKALPDALFVHPSDDADAESTPQQQQFIHEIINEPTPTPSSASSLHQRLRYAGKQVWERMDTMKAAGLCDNGMEPLQSGFKTNVGLLVAAFLFKWYRARFINKIPVWDRQPQWNMVITSPEQEKELHAYSCLKCGATIFIARHREWFFQGGNTVCTNCGAKGAENFVDVRGEVIDSIDDDYFDYESPLDFVSAAERRKLVKQAGGDEELAKKLAIENAMKNDKEQIKVEKSSSTGGNAEKNQKKKKQKSAPTKEPEDIFDELDNL
ncbi:hypothetical protein ACHAWU_003599 [Discostella pseudostelligera]|uniref:Rubredoxin-like domain-containing protein n=2 Tax=Discostella pseudostelligera TaxID=259834 RepID=A0ABD3MD73_9STRA